MSKRKRKRYIVYKTVNYGLFNQHASWQRYKEKTREELINYVISQGEELFNHLLKETVGNVCTYVSIPTESSRLGIKEWKRYDVHWYCIKVLHNGEEIPIDYQALYNEAIRVSLKRKTTKKKHYYWEHKYCVNWKKQYKCKHQYEIHMNPHKDTIKLASKKLAIYAPVAQ